MTEKSSKRTGIDPLAHAPAVAIVPPIRCFHRDGRLPGFPCGELARWQRTGNQWFATEYFCDEHHALADIEIPAVYPFRRVRINVDIYLAACAVNPPMAQTEAIVRLEIAVKAIGGVTDVNAARSDIVKSSGLPLPLPRRARPNNPE